MTQLSTYHLIPSFQLCFVAVITFPVSLHFMCQVVGGNICFPSYWRIELTDIRS